MTDIPIAAIRKNTRETIRVDLSEYQGHDFANLRIWFEPEGGGELRPSKKGIAVPLRILADVHEALGAALVEARRHGRLRTADVLPYRRAEVIEE